jgi:hypothetical protein
MFAARIRRRLKHYKLFDKLPYTSFMLVVVRSYENTRTERAQSCAAACVIIGRRRRVTVFVGLLRSRHTGPDGCRRTRVSRRRWRVVKVETAPAFFFPSLCFLPSPLPYLPKTNPTTCPPFGLRHFHLPPARIFVPLNDSRTPWQSTNA